MNSQTRGGPTFTATMPNGQVITRRWVGRKTYRYVVVCNHSKVGWGYFRWCEALIDAELCRAIDVPRSKASWGFTEVVIIPCQEVRDDNQS